MESKLASRGKQGGNSGFDYLTGSWQACKEPTFAPRTNENAPDGLSHGTLVEQPSPEVCS
jgi:hypothetical protein